MGIFDNLKDKSSGLIDEHGDKISEGLDKAREFANEKTGGQYSEKMDQGTEFAKDQLDNLDGENDDIPDSQP